MDFNPDLCASLLQNCLQRVADKPLTVERLFAARVLRSSLFKKWLPPDSSPLDEIAKQTFILCNDDCARFTLNAADSAFEGSILRRFKDALHSSFHAGELQANVLTLQACLDNGRNGPGSSVGTKRTDFYGKMCASTLTYTDEGLYLLYKNNTNQTWRDMELQRSIFYGESLVLGSNSTTVPKDCNTNRMICTEPSLNMFYQLGAGVVIEGILLKRHNIDLSKQPNVNKAMARLGSINGMFATIDLKNASNTICTALVKYGIPKSAFDVLDKIRSKSTRIDGKYHKLNMFSSMGNGFTFPLQTLIFATLVRSVYEELGIKPVAFGPNRNYGVFGDDIICLASVYDVVNSMLNSCGFTVNCKKSYGSGPFRESCGGDYFRGTDVRGVYLREIKTNEDIYCIFNRLTRWSIKHRIDLSDVLDYFLGLVDFRPVPLDCGDNAGFKYPSTLLINPRRDAQGALYYRASEAVPTKIMLEGDVSAKDSCGGTGEWHAFNNAGLYLSYLGGFVSNVFRAPKTKRRKARRSPQSSAVKYEFHTEGHQVTTRTTETTWKIVRRKTPSWDFVPHVGLNVQDYERVWMTLRNN